MLEYRGGNQSNVKCKQRHHSGKLVYMAKTYWRQSTHELANFLKKDPSAVSHMLAKAEQTLDTPRMSAILSQLNIEKEKAYA